MNNHEEEREFHEIHPVPTEIALREEGKRNRKHGRDQNEIGRKSVDFLLCRKDFSIVTAIELNGPTHATASQQKSDETKRRTLEEAGIPLITIYPQDIPAVEEIRKKIAPMMVARSQYEASRNERNGFNKRSRHGANP